MFTKFFITKYFRSISNLTNNCFSSYLIAFFNWNRFIQISIFSFYAISMSYYYK